MLDLDHLTITKALEMMEAGTLTSESLVAAYLEEIKRRSQKYMHTGKCLRMHLLKQKMLTRGV